MKPKINLLLIALCATFAFQSCDDDDDDPSSIPTAVQNAFDSKFSSAYSLDWDIENGYYVADFYLDGLEMEAWFSSDGTWQMTETDYGVNLSLIPSEVQEAYTASDYYTTWTLDDIDFYERSDIEFYLIEIEQTGQTDRKLYYNTDGTLIKDVADTANDDILPTTTI